jgi:hypothetical protein
MCMFSVDYVKILIVTKLPVNLIQNFDVEIFWNSPAWNTEKIGR